MVQDPDWPPSRVLEGGGSLVGARWGSRPRACANAGKPRTTHLAPSQRGQPAAPQRAHGGLSSGPTLRPSLHCRRRGCLCHPVPAMHALRSGTPCLGPAAGPQASACQRRPPGAGVQGGCGPFPAPGPRGLCWRRSASAWCSLQHGGSCPISVHPPPTTFSYRLGFKWGIR